MNEPPFDASTLPPVADIRSNIDSILKLKRQGKTLGQVQLIHLKFARQYPKLVETAMQPDLDRKQLEYLLTMFEQVQTEQVSFDRASHQVGRTIFDRYVAPDLTPAQRATVNLRVGDLERTHAQGGEGAQEIARMAAQMAGGSQQASGTTTEPTTNRAQRRAKVRSVPKR